MTRYLLRRTGLLLLAFALAVTILFVVLRVLGNPVFALISVGATDAEIAAAAARLGVDRPIHEQYFAYIGQLLSFDLGQSFTNHLSVGDEILRRLNVTLPLTLLAFTLSVLIAVPVGFFAAWKSRTWYGTAFSAASQLGGAVPVFWVGILLVAVLSLGWRIFPAGGFPRTDWEDPGAALYSLTLPVLTIALVAGSDLARYVRSATLDILGQQYLRAARAAGQSFATALLRHGVRNGVVPLISILAIQLSTTFVGAVIIERVFALPGLGDMLLVGIKEQDFPSVQGVLLFSTALVLVLGFIADVLQRIIDPRLRDSISGNRRTKAVA
ncbi:ABC transporter permease [Microbacterium sp. zg-B96]|uniref:ABC transporter permease n=1 Tax=Microbacterium sp. zg-B96 TaxID=3049069 RepID=UPI00214CCE13|nr:ABC transporter permease [Microbacterium sp. zg-B96]MCR2784242.1 ABC transporter permease [Microbacterium sp. zg.B96]WIM17621.1 ABC transporter permease [Microbacterium sp. zg-B96]